MISDVHIETFVDQYDLAAGAYGVEVDQLKARDALQSRELHRWLALDVDGVAGVVTTWLRPDNRIFLNFACPDPGAYLPLTETVRRKLRRPVYVTSDSRDARKHQHLLSIGYQVEMTSQIFVVPFGEVLERLIRVGVPSGFQILSAADVPIEDLFKLDNALRREVPGTEDWAGDIEWIRAELAESPPFDRDGYLVGFSPRGEMAGLVRIWRNEGGPRLGMVATLPRFRPTRIGPALIRTGLTAAAAWGHETFVTETSLYNRHVFPRLREIAVDSLGLYHQLVFAD